MKLKWLILYVLTAITLLIASALSAAGPTMAGPAEVDVNSPVTIKVTGLPEPDLTKPLGESFGWLQDVQVTVSGPDGSESVVESSIGLNIAPLSWRMELEFTPEVAGVYVVVYAYFGEERQLQTYRVQAGQAPQPPPETDPTDPPLPQKVTAVTYVYEKDDNAVPAGVATALQRINTETPEITATEFDQDTVNGLGETPAQYQSARQAALQNGLPCLVVLTGDSIVSIVDDPQTEAAVMEAVK